MRRAVFPLLLFIWLCFGTAVPVSHPHRVAKLDAAPLTASRAGRSPSPLRGGVHQRPAAGRRPRGGGAEGGGL